MPATDVVIRLTPELEAELVKLREDLVPAIEAAAALASEARALLAFVPPEVSPVVVQRQRLAGLQAALDDFAAKAGPFLEETAVEAPGA